MSKYYAFIDSQNLNLGTKAAGWTLDFRKFRLYLRNKFGADRAYLFIGLKPGNEQLYRRLQEMGYILVFKPTIWYMRDGKESVKGNVDAELVLHAAAIEYNNYDRAIIVSGDGDFACLMQFLSEREKLLHIMTPNKKYSQLLKPYASFIIQVDQLRNALEYQKTGISGRSKP